MRNQRAEFREYEYRIRVKDMGFSLFDDSIQTSDAVRWDLIPENQSMVVGDRIVSIRAKTDTSVRVLVDVRESAPEDSGQNLLLVGECSLDVPSGRVVIAGSADYFPDAARIPVRPALYKMRVCIGSLDTIYGGVRKSQDHYKVVLWLF